MKRRAFQQSQMRETQATLKSSDPVHTVKYVSFGRLKVKTRHGIEKLRLYTLSIRHGMSLLSKTPWTL